MGIDWCKKFGHDWKPIYVKGTYLDVEVKFIACICRRCDEGYDEIMATIKKMTINETSTYNEKYFKK